MAILQLLTSIIDIFDTQMDKQRLTYTVIQNTWGDEEDQELFEYFKQNGINFRILSAAEILTQNALHIDVLYADTEIIQQFISKYSVPETYPICFKSKYHRKIQKIQFSKCLSLKKPFFTKPCSNNKAFDGMKVTNDSDLQYLATKCGQNELVYICELVEFVNEYRIFVADFEIFAIQESSHYILNSDCVRSVDPPQTFLNDITAANVYKFCVIDVGLMTDGKWSVVEVNPPFALSSYGLDISKYCKYCKTVWNVIKQLHLT